jgi:hypothetical protein
MTYLDSEDRDEIRKDTRFFGFLAMKWIALFIGVFVIVGLIYAFWVRPAMLNAESRAARHSVQYVETQRTFLLQKLSACQQLDTEIHVLENNQGDPDLLAGKQAQKKAFLREMSQRVALIGDKSAVPSEVTDYLTANKEAQTP